jgi:hypothetical protein
MNIEPSETAVEPSEFPFGLGRQLIWLAPQAEKVPPEHRTQVEQLVRKLTVLLDDVVAI